MGIIALTVGSALAVASVVLAWKNKDGRYALLFFLVIPAISVPMMVALSNEPLLGAYPYRAEVELESNGGREETIYFSDFTQDGYKVVINGYAKRATHWTDFQGYDVVDRKLVVLLTGGGSFEWSAREPEEDVVSGKCEIDTGVDIATQ